MRFEQLLLTRYGHFTDFKLDFGVKPTHGKPDIHVLYGPNEAGKSTTLSAITDLLHGIPRQTPWNFLHKNEILLIEAVLHQAGQSVTLKRFKNQLTNAANERIETFPLDLQGLTRDDYIRRFSFDEQTLTAGGEQILKSEGDIGQALFSASAGLSDLKERIDAAMHSANEFWMPNRTKNTRLKVLKDALQENKRKMAAAKLDVNTWKARQNSLVDAEIRKRKAREDKDALVDARRRLETRKMALHVAKAMVQHANLQASLISQGIANTKAITARGLNSPEQVRAEIDALRALIALNRQAESREQEQIAQLTTLRESLSELSSSDNDTLLLNLRKHIEDLHAGTSAAYEWQQQLADFQYSINACEQAIQADLQRLHKSPDTDLTRLTPDVTRLDSLASLVDEGRSITGQFEHAAKELALVKNDSSDLHTSNDEALELTNQNPAVDTSVATDVLRRIQREALPQALENLTQERLDVQLLLHTQANHLGVDVCSTTSITIPDETWLNTTLLKQSDAMSNISQVEKDLRKINQQIHTKKDSCEQLTQNGFISESQINDSKKIRDKTWQRHRANINSEACINKLDTSAAEFEQQMLEHDSKELRARSHHEQSAKYNLLQQQILQDTRVQSKLEEKLARLRLQAESINTDLVAQVKPFYVDSSIDPDSLRKRFMQVVKLRDLQLQWENLNIRVEQLEKQCDDQCLVLINVIEQIETPRAVQQLRKLCLKDLLIQSEKIIDQEQLRYQQQQEAAKLSQQKKLTLARRVSDHQLAADSLNQWQARWSAATADTLLEGLTLNQGASALPVVRRLDTAQSERFDAQHNHDRLAKKIDTRDTAIATLLSQVNHTCLTDAVDALNNAVEASTHKNTLEKQIKTVSTVLQQITTDKRSGMNDQATQLALYEVPSVDELLALLDRTEQYCRSKNQYNLEEQRLISILGSAMSEQELNEFIADSEDDVLESELNSLQSQLQEAEHHHDETNRQWAVANEAVNALGEDSHYAQLTTQRANLLVELEEGARETAQARCGQLALQAAIARFRQQHQSSLLSAAQEAFTTLTAGHYTSLIPHDDGRGRQRLMATDQRHNARAVNELSTGTRYQLYLALRAAAYADYAQQKTPLPFVADDIMETFDDERSAAAFQVLGQMAKHGQVLYLTHHRHLLDIAQSVLGEDHVRIHHYS